jgi:hypothetical protein
MTHLLPCPFCGSSNVDSEGWASTERAGPACDDCAGTADTVELWNSRPRPDVSQYVKSYEFRFDDGAGYVPTEHERAMLEDAIEGYLAERLPPSPQASEVPHE